MNKENTKYMIANDPEYIASKRFNYSLSKLIERYPDGCPDRVIANALQMSENEIEDLYKCIIVKLRKFMKVENSL